MPTLFQAGTLIGILQGVYDGDVDFKTLAQHGDIGVGTFNGVDGEMIALDGIFYRIDAAGVAEVADPDAYTPFAIVAKFKAAHSFAVNNVNSLLELNQLIDEHIDSPNIFYMVRVDGDLSWIKIRSESCQMQPHNPDFTALPSPQPAFELHHVSGSLVITRCPSYSGAFTISGYHYHFLDHSKTTGGHVADLKLKQGKIMITPIRRFSMALSQSRAFDEANLEINIEDALRKLSQEIK
jgi:acetolactate decarboxylase